jgi:hypothetical protein
LTVEELRSLIRETVAETLISLLSIDDADPDAGKELRPEFLGPLLESYKKTQMGERGIPASVVAKELGIDWDGL